MTTKPWPTKPWQPTGELPDRIADHYEGGFWIPQANYSGDVNEMMAFEEGCDTDEDRAEWEVAEIWVRETVPPPPWDRDEDDGPLVRRDSKTGRFKRVPWYEQCKDSTWKGAQPWWHVRYRR
jgi:hypothetical protein